MGLVSVPGNKSGRESWETRSRFLDHIRISQSNPRTAHCKITPSIFIFNLDWVTGKIQSHEANCFAHIRVYLFSFWMPWRISSNSMWAVLRLKIHVCARVRACARTCLTDADGLQCLTLPHTLTDLPPGKGHKIRCVYNVCTCSCIVREDVRVTAMLCECVLLLQMVPSVSYSSTLSQMTLHWENTELELMPFVSKLLLAPSRSSVQISHSLPPIAKFQYGRANDGSPSMSYTHTQCKSPACTISRSAFQRGIAGISLATSWLIAFYVITEKLVTLIHPHCSVTFFIPLKICFGVYLGYFFHIRRVN